MPTGKLSSASRRNKRRHFWWGRRRPTHRPRMVPPGIAKPTRPCAEGSRSLFRRRGIPLEAMRWVASNGGDINPVACSSYNARWNTAKTQPETPLPRSSSTTNFLELSTRNPTPKASKRPRKRREHCSPPASDARPVRPRWNVRAGGNGCWLDAQGTGESLPYYADFER